MYFPYSITNWRLIVLYLFRVQAYSTNFSFNSSNIKTIAMGSLNELEGSDAVSSNVPVDLPVIDHRLLSASSEIRNGALKQLDESFQKYGFIYLSNHSIP